MQGQTLALLRASRRLGGAAVVAAGSYALPVLIAPPDPANEQGAARQAQASFRGTLQRDRRGSDRLHWGEGQVSIGPDAISLMGKLAPGPDYQLSRAPHFGETAADFARRKEKVVKIGPVKPFDNFIVPLPAYVNPADYDSVIIWCETFGQFITAARYRP